MSVTCGDLPRSEYPASSDWILPPISQNPSAVARPSMLVAKRCWIGALEFQSTFRARPPAAPPSGTTMPAVG